MLAVIWPQCLAAVQSSVQTLLVLGQANEGSSYEAQHEGCEKP